MFDYLLFFTLLAWYKNPAYLQIILNNLSWLSAILYSKLKTSDIYNTVHNYLLILPTTPKSNKNIKFYSLQNETIKEFQLKDINNIVNGKIYIRIPIESSEGQKEKILIFNDKQSFSALYKNALEKINNYKEHFSTILESTINNIDVQSVLLKYINNSGDCKNYYILTGYHIKAGDIYDFDSNKFLLQSNDETLNITNMKLDNFELKKDAELVSVTEFNK